MLFPAEDTEGDEVDDHRPCGHERELGAELRQPVAFVHDVANAVDDWGKRQVV